jgi:hypothetical protein
VRKQKGQKGLQTKVRKWGKLANFPEYLFVQTIVEIKSFATESFYDSVRLFASNSRIVIPLEKKLLLSCY